jgi:hypothetical protein
MRHLLTGLFLLLVACGGNDTPPPTCVGMSCTCEPGAACDLDGSACEGDSCTLDCVEDNECSGSCGDSCSLDCSGGSTCEMTVGPSSSVSCSDGAVCDIRCTGSCSLSCSIDSMCRLACGDGPLEAVVEGGACE